VSDGVFESDAQAEGEAGRQHGLSRLTSFAADSFTIKKGTRLRGDHPAVRACFKAFVEDSVPDSEVPSELSLMCDPVPEHELEARAVSVAPAIPPENAVVCHTRFLVTATGQDDPERQRLARRRRRRQALPRVLPPPH
jgi:hypothetical protein